MSTATLSTAAYAGEDEVLQYRAIHIGAVLGIALAFLLLAFTFVAASNSPEACIFVSILNLLPFVCCIWALWRIRREPERYSGLGAAQIGAALSLVLLVVGVSYGCYAYFTEVPDGYSRISFGVMKPDDSQERGGLVVPPEMTALEGQKVFIKGYMRPAEFLTVKEFLLVRDNQQCCFGALSSVKYYDRIEVKLTGDRALTYSPSRIFQIGGTLHIEPQYAMTGSPKTVFTLTADYAK